MPQPLDILFGPWAPDLQNVPQQLNAAPGPQMVPSADCLNVYYQDGAYRCLPAPAATGPALTAQVLGAFTYYDDVAGKEIVFAGTAAGMNELLDGAWSAIPFTTTGIVYLSGIPLLLTQGSPLLGYLGTMTAGNWHGVSTSEVGYDTVRSIGSISPVDDVNGYKIGQVYDFNSSSGTSFIFSIGTYATPAPNLGASYFQEVYLSSLSATFLASAASYSFSSGVNSWQWSTAAGFVTGTNYPVEIIY